MTMLVNFSIKHITIKATTMTLNTVCNVATIIPVHRSMQLEFALLDYASLVG
jgi:hypothetical protein